MIKEIKEHKFTRQEIKAFKDYAYHKISSRALGKLLGVSHTQAIIIAGKYFIREYKNNQVKKEVSK